MNEVEQLKETMKKMLIFMGIDEASSTVYACLVILDNGATVEEISKMTYYSTASVYNSLSNLREVGLVNRNKGEGHIEYYASKSCVSLFDKRRKEIIDKFLSPSWRLRDQNSPWENPQWNCLIT